MEDEHTFDKFVSEIQEKGWTLTNYEDHYKFSNHSRITGLPFAVNVVMDTEYNMNILAEELQSRCEAFDIDEYVRERLNAKAEGQVVSQTPISLWKKERILRICLLNSPILPIHIKIMK